MFMNPDLGTQLARQQQRQMLAAAERRQHGGMTPGTPGTTEGRRPSGGCAGAPRSRRSPPRNRQLMCVPLRPLFLVLIEAF